MALEPIDLSAEDSETRSQVVSLEPVFNVLYSLVLLCREELMTGLGDWVIRTKDAMSLEERQRHRLVFDGLVHAFVPDASWQSFVGYVDYLAGLRPEAFQERLLTIYWQRFNRGGSGRPDPQRSGPDVAEILSSTDRYLSFLSERFGADCIDHDLEAQAYRYVADPPAMRTLIVDHLRSMWDRYLAPEWARVRPMLKDSVDAFRQMDLSSLSRTEATRRVADRDLPSPRWAKLVEEAKRIVLVPNAHIGPYMGRLFTANSLVVVFGARFPEGARGEVPDLTRTEIITRLNALADDNRLRILRLAADRGEVRAPDVMEELDISQSAASRHLTQLSATGYLRERRREGSKYYALNPPRIEETGRAISEFLRVSRSTAVNPSESSKGAKK